MIFSDTINNLFDVHGIEKCTKQLPEYFSGQVPSPVSELFLNYSWPKAFKFKYNASGPWFTSDREALNNIYEFSPTRFEDIKSFFNLASDQSYFLCVKDEELSSNPNMYLVDYDELISASSRRARLTGYTYSPDQFTLEWFLSNITII